MKNSSSVHNYIEYYAQNKTVSKIKPFNRVKVLLKAIIIEFNYCVIRKLIGDISYIRKRSWIPKQYEDNKPFIARKAYLVKQVELQNLVYTDIHLAALALTKAQRKIRKGKKEVILWQYARKVYRDYDGSITITCID